MNTAALAIPAFGPALPEIILAVGALVLLLVRRHPRRALVCDDQHRLRWRFSAVALDRRPDAARRARRDDERVLRVRFLRQVHEVPDADRVGGRHHHVAGFHAPRRHRPLRIPDPHRALDDRHADGDLGERPDRALSRPRIAQPLVLRHRRLSTATSLARPKRA